jgi:hypothetical protein
MRASRGRPFALALAIGLVSTLAACQRDRDADTDLDTRPTTETMTDAVRVTDVELGRSIGTDGRVEDDTDEFRPTDTIYVSVDTEGSATGATLTARWTYQDGQVVDETSQTLSPSGRTVTEFHISMPEGLPAGDYRVEILLDGQTVESRDFEVQ